MARVYKYAARNDSGQTVSGTVKAKNDAEAQKLIRDKGLQPMSMSVTKGSGSGAIFGPPRIKAREIMIFTRQFATMISAGIPVFECLSVLQIQSQGRAISARPCRR
ncbi:MAG: hypothetical protein U5N86_12835 [Planctomycetota bacterium]|nr:hypothetical protein [Planctomycetota bacterium]